MQMRGLAVGHSCFVCYSGKVAKVYRVDMQLQRFDALEPVHTRYGEFFSTACVFLLRVLGSVFLFKFSIDTAKQY